MCPSLSETTSSSPMQRASTARGITLGLKELIPRLYKKSADVARRSTLAVSTHAEQSLCCLRGPQALIRIWPAFFPYAQCAKACGDHWRKRRTDCHRCEGRVARITSVSCLPNHN